MQARRLLCVLLLATPLLAQDIAVLSHREQYPIQKSWITKRFDTVLPTLMRREGADMWLVISREYNEDPVFGSLSPPTYFASRRRTMLVFFDRGGSQGVERLSIGRFNYDGIYQQVSTSTEEQWSTLRRVIEERNPKVIGINVSNAFNHADGLTWNERDQLEKAIGPQLTSRLKSAEGLAVGWLEYKMDEELDGFRQAMKIAHQIIGEAFSNKAVRPGTTTTEDLVWWMRQRVANLGMGSWFHPSVTIYRADENDKSTVIKPGDMLHTDFGIVYLGLSTDTQHLAYVLKPGEATPPAGLLAGLAAANRLQDIVFKHARIGTSGNAALANALREAKAEGLNATIYCHPIGYHGHGAGPPVGMVDNQVAIPVRGEYPFRANTWHSIELNVKHRVPEWNNREIQFAQEEDAALRDSGWEWIASRQTEFHLIRP